MLKRTSAMLATVVAAGLMLGSLPGSAQADRWYHSKGAWATYGFAAGTLTGLVLSDRPSRTVYVREPAYRQPVYRQPVYHQPVYRHPVQPTCVAPPPPCPTTYYHHPQPVYHHPQPVYHQPVVVNQHPTRIERRETRVWPFYRRTTVREVPALVAPALPTGAPMAVSMYERRQAQVAAAPVSPVTVNVTINGERATVETETTNGTTNSTTTEGVEEISQREQVVRVAMSNRAGASNESATSTRSQSQPSVMMASTPRVVEPQVVLARTVAKPAEIVVARGN